MSLTELIQRFCCNIVVCLELVRLKRRETEVLSDIGPKMLKNAFFRYYTRKRNSLFSFKVL